MQSGDHCAKDSDVNVNAKIVERDEPSESSATDLVENFEAGCLKKLGLRLFRTQVETELLPMYKASWQHGND